MFWVKTQSKDIHFFLILLEYTLFTAFPSGKVLGVSRFCFPLCKGKVDNESVFWNSTVSVGCCVVFLPGINVLRSLGSALFIWWLFPDFLLTAPCIIPVQAVLLPMSGINTGDLVGGEITGIPVFCVVCGRSSEILFGWAHNWFFDRLCVTSSVDVSKNSF